MNNKYLLIDTDGYSINTNFFDTKEDAISQMQKEYADCVPTEDSEWYEQCYCGDYDAIAYTGDNVYVWRIIEC